MFDFFQDLSRESLLEFLTVKDVMDKPEEYPLYRKAFELISLLPDPVVDLVVLGELLFLGFVNILHWLSLTQNFFFLWFFFFFLTIFLFFVALTAGIISRNDLELLGMLLVIGNHYGVHTCQVFLGFCDAVLRVRNFLWNTLPSLLGIVMEVYFFDGMIVITKLSVQNRSYITHMVIMSTIDLIFQLGDLVNELTSRDDLLLDHHIIVSSFDVDSLEGVNMKSKVIDHFCQLGLN